MSYTIEYNRQFIRTSYGYIPCWLAGDNNVTVGRGRYEKRSRDWSIFNNWVNVSEDEMLNGMKSFFNTYGEHWKRNGKWVTNDGLLSWVKSGCRRAATIEEILDMNTFIRGSHRGVHCYVLIYDLDETESIIMDMYIKTNKEMDSWSYAVNELQNENKQIKRYKYVFPVIDFVIEDLKHPIQKKELEVGKTYILGYKKGYVDKITENSLSYVKDIKKAKVFTYDELDYIKENPKYHRYFKDCKIIDSSLRDKKVYLLYVDKNSSNYSYGYVCNRRGSFSFGYCQSSAKKYYTLKEAEKGRDYIQKLLDSRKMNCIVKVVEYDESKN